MSSEPELHTLFRRDEIEDTVKRLAAEIREDYQGKYPLLIGVLKGSFIFMAELVRLLDFPLEVVVAKLEKLQQLARDLETTLAAPLATLSFLALPVIPELRLTDLGLVDVNTFKLVK